jgi:hypothetical protein
MAKLDELLKGNTPLYTIAAIMLSGGGLNFMSEGAEQDEREEMVEKIEAADYIQDVKHDALLALVNELRIPIAGMQ